MELILLFMLSGAVSWGLSALLLLVFVHALGRAVAGRTGLQENAKPSRDTGP